MKLLADKPLRYEPLRYEPLQHADEIRVLEVHSALFSMERIECTLKNVRLSTNPHFEALSYTWGEGHLVRTIKINGRPTAVRLNLFHAMRRMRLVACSRTLWIDALCINQEDLEEKSVQIPLMGSIYSHASRVLVWLGDEADSSAQAMDLIREVARAKHSDFGWKPSNVFRDPSGLSKLMPFFGRQWRRRKPTRPAHMMLYFSDPRHRYEDHKSRQYQWEKAKYEIKRKAAHLLIRAAQPVMSLDDSDSCSISSRSDNTSDWKHSERLPPHGDPAWAALVRFLQRPWFSRVWVIQEVMLARKTMFCCGDYSIDSEILKDALEVLSALNFPEEAGGMLWMAVQQLFEVELDREENNGSQLLTDLLLRTAHAKATDARDKIYALYGIVQKTHGKPPLVAVDYKQPTASLYRDVARTLLTVHGDTGFLHLSRVAGTVPGLPSWVPDFSASRNLDFTLLKFIGQGGYNLKIKESERPDELIILGAERMTLQWVGMAAPDHLDDPAAQGDFVRAVKEWAAKVSSLLGRQSFRDFWRIICNPEIADVTDTDGDYNVNGNADSDANGAEEAISCASFAAAWLARIGVTDFEIPAEDSGAGVHDTDAEWFMFDALRACVSRRLCLTSTGLLCLGPSGAREGDVVATISGAPRLFALRRHEDHQSLIGDCRMEYTQEQTLFDEYDDVKPTNQEWFNFL